MKCPGGWCSSSQQRLSGDPSGTNLSEHHPNRSWRPSKTSSPSWAVGPSKRRPHPQRRPASRAKPMPTRRRVHPEPTSSRKLRPSADFRPRPRLESPTTLPPEVSSQLEFAKRYGSLMIRASQAKAGLARLQGNQADFPAGVRAARDRLDTQIQAVASRWERATPSKPNKIEGHGRNGWR